MLLRWLQDRIGSWNLGLHSTHVVLDFSEILGPSLMDMPYSSILSLSLQSLIRQFRSTRLSNNQRCYLLKKEIPVVWTLRFIYTWLVFPAFLHQDSLLQLFLWNSRGQVPTHFIHIQKKCSFSITKHYTGESSYSTTSGKYFFLPNSDWQILEDEAILVTRIGFPPWETKFGVTNNFHIFWLVW